MTALREVFKIGKGFDGWSTYLYNLCLGDPKGSPCLLSIYYLSQLTRTLKNHNLSWFQHQVLTSSRISAFTFLLFLYTKLAKPGYQHILT
jgi:hypothetical protein